MGILDAPARTEVPTLYRPGGLRRWRVGFADAEYTPVDVLAFGDSRAWGVGSDNNAATVNAGNASYVTNSWPAVLRRLFARGLGQDPGEGWIPFWDYRWTFAGSTFGQREWGPLNYGGRQLSPGAANTATITVPAGTASVVVAFWDGGGKWISSVDGAADAEYTPGGTTTVASRTITVDPATSHTLVLKGGSTTNAYLCAVQFRTAAVGGVRVHRVGYPGADTGLATALTGSYVGGTFRAADTAKTNNIMACTFSPATPLLTIVHLDVNDWSGQVNSGITPAAFRTNVDRLVTEATVTRPGSLLWVLGPDPVPAALTAALSAYRAQVLAAADASSHMSVLDISTAWGTQAQADAAGLSISTSVHFNRKGATDIARMLHRNLSRTHGSVPGTT